MQKILAALKGGREFKNNDGTIPNAFVNILRHTIDTDFPLRFIDYPIAADDPIFDELSKRKGFTTYVLFDSPKTTEAELQTLEFVKSAPDILNSYFRYYIHETTYNYQILRFGN